MPVQRVRASLHPSQSPAPQAQRAPSTAEALAQPHSTASRHLKKYRRSIGISIHWDCTQESGVMRTGWCQDTSHLVLLLFPFFAHIRLSNRVARAMGRPLSHTGFSYRLVITIMTSHHAPMPLHLRNMGELEHTTIN